MKQSNSYGQVFKKYSRFLFGFNLISLLCCHMLSSEAGDTSYLLKNIPRASGVSSITRGFLDDEPMLTLQTVKQNGNMNLSEEFLCYLKKIFNIVSFVETGTHLGYTTYVASRVFDKVYTVELSKKIFDQFSSKLSKKSNIKCYCDESPVFLRYVLPFIRDNGPILFWLDAHYSGGETVFSGSKTAIVDELSAIKDSEVFDGIIMIDDIRYFYQEDSDYPTLSNVIKQLLTINPTYQIITFGDILLAYPATYSVKISPILRSCTLSRLYYQDHSLPIDIAYEEKIISEATGEEREALLWLKAYLARSEHLGVNNKAYTRWVGLIKNK